MSSGVSTGPFTEECVDAARGAWKARPGPRAARTMRLFRDFVPERLIFRGHPALPFVAGTPAIAWLLERYAFAPAHGPAASAGIFALGVVGWTLLEYSMHRFLFHFPARGDAGKVTTFVVHGHHHVTPGERSRLAATPVQAGSLALLVGGIAWLAFGAPTWMLVLAGTLSGYLVYEAVHHVAHHGRPRSRVLHAIQRHHMRHHYEDDGACWGISSPLWDWVFRTHRPRKADR